MKLASLVAASVLALASTAASAEKWVQYDIFGTGSYDSWDVSTDPGDFVSGAAKLYATFFIETDPMDFQDSTIIYSSDGRSYWQTDPDTFTKNVFASAGNGTLSLSFVIDDGDCGHTHCENWQINLNFAPGSFDALPGTLPQLLSGTFTFRSTSHWTGVEGSGRVWSAKATTVSIPGQSSLAISTTPVAAPEPSSWTMMLGGFGLVGATIRWRRKQVAAFA